MGAAAVPQTRGRGAYRSHPAEMDQRCAVGAGAVPLALGHLGMSHQQARYNAPGPPEPAPACVMTGRHCDSTVAARMPGQALAPLPGALRPPAAALRGGAQTDVP